MIKAFGYAAQSSTSPLERFSFERRDVGQKDVQIEILYCGVCHSDIHKARNDWHNSNYPLVPGHEIIGRVVKVGSEVTKFKEGDLAGVGVIVNSCQKCDPCNEGLEQYCEKGPTSTINGVDRETGIVNYGGYSNTMVVTERFVFHIPESLDPKSAAPLLCAGITTYSAMKHWNVGKGKTVGIVGLGGLGHIAVKLAKAFGAQVILFTTSVKKKEDALKLGADEVILSTNDEDMKLYADKLDFILDTAPTSHNINPYAQLLKRSATIVIVGALETMEPGINGRVLASKRRSVAGSYIGGMRETQEMLEFCAKNKISCDVEMIAIQDIEKAYERMKKGDVKYRFVIDMASLTK